MKYCFIVRRNRKEILEKTTVKIVQINSVFGKGSTGKICLGIAELLEKEGCDNCVLYSNAGIEHSLGMRYSDSKFVKFYAIKSRIFGNFGFNSVRETKSLIAKLDELSPELVHLHNIHSHDCHFEILLSYLKKRNIKTVWTFHDCWCFTGYCAYFDAVGCDKWKKNCHSCPQKKNFSLFFDKSMELHNKKKAAFEGLNLTIVTPSKWLAGMVKESFLKDFPVYVINNGIDLNVFKPTENPSVSIKNSNDEKIVLGVADIWGYRKGLDVFIKLSQRLPKKYRIVLVGTDENIDKQLPKNIVSIHRTNNQKELAEIYAAADVFVNPTREENYPTVNMESLACGTPVLTFRTGGSSEILDETCGAVVDCDDVKSLEKEIFRICEEKPYSKRSCVKRAEEFDKNKRFKEYVKLYERIKSSGIERN